MSDQELLARISCDPGILAGKPTVRGTRLSIDFILNLRAHGMTEGEIFAEYPGIQPEDLQACYLFAGDF